MDKVILPVPDTLRWQRMKALHSKSYGRFLFQHPFIVTNHLTEDEVKEYELLLDSYK